MNQVNNNKSNDHHNDVEVVVDDHQHQQRDHHHHHPEETVVADVSSPSSSSSPPPPIEIHFMDHFSLKQPSSTVRSRTTGAAGGGGTSTTRVYDLANDQLQLEHRWIHCDNDDDDDIKMTNNVGTTTTSQKLEFTMQRLRGGNLGLRILRTWYTLVALLMAGFMFVLTCNIIVMQAMEIPRNANEADGAEVNTPVMIANILSMPLLVYSMASIMVFASVFVSDTWNGHVLFSLLVGTNNNNSIPRVYVEWYCFILYLGVPLMAYIIASLMGQAPKLAAKSSSKNSSSEMSDRRPRRRRRLNVNDR